MTGTGLLVGILAGIGVIAIVAIISVVVAAKKFRSEMKRDSGSDNEVDVGFALFKKKVIDLLQEAPRGSTVSATFPIPSVEAFVKVSGRRADQNSYQLEIRMGYKRLDHLEMIQSTISTQALNFERVDNGNGSIKLLSEKVSEISELLEICRNVKSSVMFDLNDKGISVAESIRRDGNS